MLERSLRHLKYSYDKCRSVDMSLEMSDEDYESFDSFSSRFMRTYEVLINQVIRSSLELCGEYKDTLIDNLNVSEKLGFILSAEEMNTIRKLRNKVAHEYADREWIKIYQQLIKYCPALIHSADMCFKQIASRKLIPDDTQ